jgi:hypothetical protein
MATEVRNHGQGNDHQQERREEMDKEIQEVRARIGKLSFKM